MFDVKVFEGLILAARCCYAKVMICLNRYKGNDVIGRDKDACCYFVGEFVVFRADL